ncbi:stage III sporulation protein AA [Virgibacillus sp. W0181]|uniref:stage III sporulation protein AA n=1 Tax=Virgibacillus sp. W0181 TaxID=3391581 RepID=UPI003F46E6CB
MEEILRLFTDDIKQAVISKVENRWDKLQEIRIRLYQPLEIAFDENTEWIETVKPNKKDGIFLLNQMSQFSLYRMEDELREGYITIEGGHRVGIAGKVNTAQGHVKALQYITFFNIRIAKQLTGISSGILPHLYNRSNNNYFNTLFIGAPQTGKTTLIRDVARVIGTGWKHTPPKKVGVIDERSEIAASIKGVPQHNLGLRTDIMDACPKAEGMMMMIRSMSPDVLIIDEIGSTQDVQALMEAIHAGVQICCTIHGQSMDELNKRPSLHDLLRNDVFDRYVLLSKRQTPGHVKSIYNGSRQLIWG